MKMRMVFVWLLALAVPAFGQARGYVWENGRLKEIGRPIEYVEPYEGEEESPVANKLWLGNVGVEGKWDDNANWDPANTPVDGDDVVLNRTSSISVTSGLNQSGIDLNSLTVHSGYTGDIGASGGPLIINTALDDTGVIGNIIKQGPGAFYIEAGAGGTGKIEFLYIDTDEQSTEIEIDGVINNVSLIKGRVAALAGFDGKFVWVSYRNNPTSDVHFTLQSTAALNDLVLNGGTILYDGTTITAIVKMSGGRIIQGINAGKFSGIIQSGGYIEYNGTGTISVATLLGGTLDLSQDGRPKTVSLLSVFPGAKFLPNANTTIVNNTQGSILPIVPIIP